MSGEGTVISSIGLSTGVRGLSVGESSLGCLCVCDCCCCMGFDVTLRKRKSTRNIVSCQDLSLISRNDCLLSLGSIDGGSSVGIMWRIVDESLNFLDFVSNSHVILSSHELRVLGAVNIGCDSNNCAVCGGHICLSCVVRSSSSINGGLTSGLVSSTSSRAVVQSSLSIIQCGFCCIHFAFKNEPFGRVSTGLKVFGSLICCIAISTGSG